MDRGKHGPKVTQAGLGAAVLTPNKGDLPLELKASPTPREPAEHRFLALPLKIHLQLVPVRTHISRNPEWRPFALKNTREFIA